MLQLKQQLEARAYSEMHVIKYLKSNGLPGLQIQKPVQEVVVLIVKADALICCARLFSEGLACRIVRTLARSWTLGRM